MLNNVGIKVLDEEHGKKVVEWFKSQGVNTRGYEGIATDWVYGVFDGKFDCRHTDNWCIKHHPNFQFIKLPEELPKDWYIQITYENYDELQAWRKSVCDKRWVNSKPLIGYFVTSKHNFDGSNYVSYESEQTMIINYPNYVKIDLETFRKITSTMEQQENKMPDFTIKGTKLPEIPIRTEHRACKWLDSTVNSLSTGHQKRGVSYGKRLFKGDVYVLAEIEDYAGSNYWMYKLSDVQRLWKEQNPTQKIEMKPRKISSEQAQSIIDAACPSWKTILAEKWGKNIVVKNNVEISEQFYQEMRKACTAPQNELFDKIFGKDDGSVDLTNINSSKLLEITNRMITVRNSAKGSDLDKKSFYLSKSFNWEIKMDTDGSLCLIPTKIKK